MFHKWHISVFAIYALTACNNGPKAEGLWVSYNCLNLTNLESNGIRLYVKTRLKTSQNTPSFNLAGRSLRGYELYETDVTYTALRQNSDNPDAFTPQTYFEYENTDLILKVPKHEDLPACEIRFNKGDTVGEHKCDFEKSGKGSRAKAFSMECHAAPKMGHIDFDN